jgi:hypothetical protein
MKTNGKHEVIARIAGLGLVLAALLAMVLSGSSVGRAQSSAASPAVPAAAPAKAASQAQPAAQPAQTAAPGKPAPKGTQEGIKIHGHWTIEVRNPDGKLVSHTEFENSLASGTYGQGVLASLLSGQLSTGGWAIFLYGPPAVPGNSEYPCGTNSSPTACQIYSPSVFICPANSSSYCFPTLSVTPTSPGASNVVTLQGTAVAGNNSGVVGYVVTNIAVCGSTVAPANCTAASNNFVTPLWYETIFSSRSLDGVSPDPPQVNVTSMQTISVTVQFSFASGS